MGEKYVLAGLRDCDCENRESSDEEVIELMILRQADASAVQRSVDSISFEPFSSNSLRRIVPRIELFLVRTILGQISRIRGQSRTI